MYALLLPDTYTRAAGGGAAATTIAAALQVERSMLSCKEFADGNLYNMRVCVCVRAHMHELVMCREYFKRMMRLYIRTCPLLSRFPLCTRS